MPNLLAHYGAQGILTRAAFPVADFRWILLGCFIPDVPWVTQRALQTLLPGMDLHTLRLYAVIQASLLFALLLAAVFALLANRTGLVFGILSLNVVLHLILDSLQEKWGVGVHLLVPLRWDEWNAEIFAMEGWVTYGLTGLGLAFCVWAWRRRGPDVRWRAPTGGTEVRAAYPEPVETSRGGSTPAHAGTRRSGRIRSLLPAPHGGRRLAAAGLLLGAYLLLPVPFLDQALASDSHSIRTLVEVDERPGRSITMDREPYVARAEGDIIVMTVGDTLWLDRRYLDGSHKVSARGEFVDERTVRIDELQVHRPYFRDGASYLALLVLAAFWIAGVPAWWRRGTARPFEGSG